MQKLLLKYKYEIYSVVSYICGLIIGIVLYINCLDKFKNLFQNIFIINNISFQQAFIKTIIQYSLLFLLIVIFSYSIVGEYVLNIIPLLLGIELALKLSFYYSHYSMKGIGYSLLIIIPEASIFVLVIILSICKGITLSKGINNVLYKENATIEINLKSHFKAFILYFALLISLSLINSTLVYLLSSLITL